MSERRPRYSAQTRHPLPVSEHCQPSEVLARHMSESELSDCVLRVAKLNGWDLAYRTWNSMHSPAGFPDWVFCRPPRLMFAELKRLGKVPRPAQQAWLDALRACPGVEVYLWTAEHWLAGEVERVLSRQESER